MIYKPLELIQVFLAGGPKNPNFPHIELDFDSVRGAQVVAGSLQQAVPSGSSSLKGFSQKKIHPIFFGHLYIFVAGTASICSSLSY